MIKKILGGTLGALILTASVGLAVVSPAQAAPSLYLPFPAGVGTSVTQSPHGTLGEVGYWAVDFGLARNSPVIASAGGVVRRSANLGYPYEENGLHVLIDHGNNFCTQYNHLATSAVSVGQSVSRAQHIGTVGSTGLTSAGWNHPSSGEHLHWDTVYCDSYKSVGKIGSVEYPGGFSTGMWVTSQNTNTVATQLSDTIAVQANTGELWKATSSGGTPMGFGMMKGTSPAVAKLSNGQQVYAFQANTGSLWTIGPDGVKDHQFGMMAGTSPSIAAIPSGGYRVAAQANTGSLWTIGPEGMINRELGMMPGTSPSIATLANGNVAVAMQANTGSLWTIADDGKKDWRIGMMAGTSPAITTVGNNYQAAVQANTGSLITVGHFGSKDWGLGMMKGSSPSITTLTNGGWVAAVQANTGSLMTVGSAGGMDHRQGMMAGTSPAVSAQANGGYQVAFHANTGSLMSTGSLGGKNYQVGMMAGTSPSFGR